MSALAMVLPPRDGFRPGETIEVVARWDLDFEPQKVEANLVWHTRGIGNEDVGVGATDRIESPDARDDSHVFRLRAPAFPYTFSGKLISLDWEVELIAVDERGRTQESARETIVIAPDAVEIELG